MLALKSSSSGSFSVTVNDSLGQSDLKSGVKSSPYYNSMDYTNYHFQKHSCNRQPSVDDPEKNGTFAREIKTYKKRFLMLFLASFCSMMNGLPQFQYTVVADIISCYYSESILLVDWTCMVYMVVFIPLVFPVMYFMDKKGLRYTVLAGGFLNFLGGWIQCASFQGDRFLVIMVSQTVYAVGQVFLLSVPPFIAGVWFGEGEVGLACALGVFGNQLGVATGFIVPPLVIDNNCTHTEQISYQLSIIAYPIAVVNTVLLIILIAAFQEKPPLYPSVAQAAKQNVAPPNYSQSLLKFVKDFPFLLLFAAYGIITGAYFAMSAIMNQMVLIHFEGAEVDAGWMGALMVFAGMAGSILLGSILDRTHRFKEITVAAFATSFVLLVIYSLLIIYDTALWVQFLFFGLLGFFTAGYLPVGFDFAAEITYPESEAISGSLLNASCQLFSIAMTFASSKLIESYRDTASNIFLCVCLLLGTIITACIKCELKRTHAAKLEDKDVKSRT